MRYVPVHKKTGRRYSAISEKEMDADWSKEPYRSNFRFEPVEEAPEPKEAKKVEPTEKQEKEGDNPPKG